MALVDFVAFFSVGAVLGAWTAGVAIRRFSGGEEISTDELVDLAVAWFAAFVVTLVV